MKVLYFAVGLIIPVGLLLFSWITAEEPYLVNLSSTSGHDLTIQAEAYTHDISSLNDPHAGKQMALDQMQAP